MRVLVACEYSGAVRSAFRDRGHDAWSCDLLPADDSPEYHLQCDVLKVLNDGWDLMIAHPPCTYLARSSMRWLKDQPPLKSGKLVGAERRQALKESLEFFEELREARIEKICIENPRSFLIPYPATQYIQPWQFGHPAFKETGLWLKNLRKLEYTTVLVPPTKKDDPEEYKRWSKIHNMPPGELRWKERSKTYEGIARAMAAQWG